LFLCTAWRVRSVPASPPARLTPAVAGIAGAAVAFSITPAALHASMAHEPTQIFAGGSIPTGFVVIDDNAPPPAGVRSRKASEFVKIMGITALEQEWGPFIQPLLKSAPFAVFWAPRIGQSELNMVYFGPADVLTRRDVKAWKFTIEQPAWKKTSVPVEFVRSAEPYLPAPQ
jgi:hypothetical protein